MGAWGLCGAGARGSTGFYWNPRRRPEGGAGIYALLKRGVATLRGSACEPVDPPVEIPVPNPCYRLMTARMVLRCWEPADTESLLAALARNRPRLVRWMPWAEREPLPLDEKLTWVRERRARFDRGEDFAYGAFDPGSGALLGGAGLHARCGPGGLEVGYWIDRDHEGQGLASEAAAALTRVGIEVYGARRIEIRVDPQNAASARIPVKLGFSLEGRLRARQEFEGGWRDLDSFSMTAEAHPGSPAAAYPLRAFDALDRELL